MAAKRGKLVTARISEETDAWFEQMASGSGLPKSTLVAFILGEWVYKQKAMYQPMMDAALKAITATMTREMDGLDQVLEKVLPDLIKDMAAEKMRLDSSPALSNSRVPDTKSGQRRTKKNVNSH